MVWKLSAWLAKLTWQLIWLGICNCMWYTVLSAAPRRTDATVRHNAIAWREDRICFLTCALRGTKACCCLHIAALVRVQGEWLFGAVGRVTRLPPRSRVAVCFGLKLKLRVLNGTEFCPCLKWRLPGSMLSAVQSSSQPAGCCRHFASSSSYAHRWNTETMFSDSCKLLSCIRAG